MVAELVDSSVLVDILRGYPDAQAWFNQQPVLYITRITWIEVIQGARDKIAQQRSLKLMRRFGIIELDATDITMAADLMLNWRLKLNIDLGDCLLCATVMRLKLPFYTRNLKHFSPILGTLASSPY